MNIPAEGTRNIKNHGAGVMIPGATRIKVDDEGQYSPNQIIIMESDTTPDKGDIINGGRNLEEEEEGSSMAQMRVVRSCESSKF